MAMTAGKRRLALLGVALLMAGFAAFLIKVYLDRKTAELEASYSDNTEKMRIVVPKRDLAAGVRIVLDDFAIRPIQVDLAPPDAIRPEDIERAIGQSLKVALPLGRPLLWGYLSSGTNPSFSDMLDEDRRALTIAVDELNSISGMIRPYDRIDLFIIGKDKKEGPVGKDAKVVLPLLQDVLVKATGNIVRRETAADGREYDRHYSTLTLDLLPEEIGKVLIAQENGELKAALKRPEQNAANYLPTRETDLWLQQDEKAKDGLTFYVGGKGTGVLEPRTLDIPEEEVIDGALAQDLAPLLETAQETRSTAEQQMEQQMLAAERQRMAQEATAATAATAATVNATNSPQRIATSPTGTVTR
jgi:pilus assembly protein CpaB